MKHHLAANLVALAFGACAPGNPPLATTISHPVATLTAEQKSSIGKKIWQNESAGTVNGLTAWNAGEEFPSLGIGHFIWYPAGFNGRFRESWPEMIAFATQQGTNPPAIARMRHSPWSSRTEFQKHFNSAEMVALRRWLATHVAVQTDYIIARSRDSLPNILAAAPASERSRIRANYHKVASSSQGTYALIDYVNFKGDGTSPTETYNGQGWGLLQVLGNMKDVPAGPAAANEFAAAAKRILSRRIAHSPPERGEARWRVGWHHRCDTYARPL